MNTSIRIILFILLFIWVLGNFSPMLSDSFASFSILQFILAKSYSLVCHQDPLKLICINGDCTQLCARCTGIYIGALIMSFITTFIRKIETPDIRLGGSTVLLMFLDIICYNIGIYNYNVWIASSTGLFLGSVAFLYIRNGIEKLLFELK